MMDAERAQPDLAPPPAAVRWTIRTGAAAAMALSGVLFWESMGAAGKLPGCGPESGCDTVLSSKWSEALGVPVAAAAVAVYAVILAASLHIGPSATPRRRRVAAWALTAGATMAVAAAVYFTGIQLVALGALCRYCVATHAAGLVAGVAALSWSLRGLGRRVGGQAVALGTASVAMLVALQAATPAQTHQLVRGEETPDADVAGRQPRDLENIVLNRGNAPLPEIRLNPHDYPILGSPDAPVVIAELIDYTCPHCRMLHRQFHTAMDRYRGELAIVTLHMPLDADCNPLVKNQNPAHATACELARLALAVWRADAARFGEYHDWLMNGDAAPSPEAARTRAAELVGEAALAAAASDPQIDARIERNIGLYSLFQRSLPIVLLPRSIMYGRPGTDAALFELLEAETALESPAH